MLEIEPVGSGGNRVTMGGIAVTMIPSVCTRMWTEWVGVLTLTRMQHATNGV